MPISEDDLKYIRDFYNSTAGQAVFEELETGLMQDWSTTSDLASREQLWQQMQALRALQAQLRDATANKRLTQKGQNYTA